MGERKLRIKIVRPIPVKAEFGLGLGLEFDVLSVDEWEPRSRGRRPGNPVWVMGLNGEKVKLLPGEYEAVNA